MGLPLPDLQSRRPAHHRAQPIAGIQSCGRTALAWGNSESLRTKGEAVSSSRKEQVFDLKCSLVACCDNMPVILKSAINHEIDGPANGIIEGEYIVFGEIH